MRYGSVDAIVASLSLREENYRRRVMMREKEIAG
jgi:hypothetical protein